MVNWLSKISMPAMNNPVPIISPQEAHDTCWGPYYHGTSTEERVDAILSEGFKWEEGEARNGGVAQGYEKKPYYNTGCFPPVHHLGYGVYLTAKRNLARDQSAYGNIKNVLEFYLLKSANILRINYAAPNTMLKWWQSMGYDCELAKTDRVAATKKLTQTLASQYDAVYHECRGMYSPKKMDGNQICVYNTDIIRRVDKKLVRPGEFGSKVIRKSDGMIGTLAERRPLDPEISQQYHHGEKELIMVIWKDKSFDRNVYPSDVEFV